MCNTKEFYHQKWKGYSINNIRLPRVLYFKETNYFILHFSYVSLKLLKRTLYLHKRQNLFFCQWPWSRNLFFCQWPWSRNLFFCQWPWSRNLFFCQWPWSRNLFFCQWPWSRNLFFCQWPWSRKPISAHALEKLVIYSDGMKGMAILREFLPHL